MRYPLSEKLEIIRLVERSHLPAKRTLWRSWAFPAPRFIAGTTAIRPADRRPWRTAARGLAKSGTVSPMR